MYATEKPNGFIPMHGGYRNLLTYQKSEIIYDATVSFCKRYFSMFDRTREQMTQAARSGKQNIAEASMVSATSKEGEIKLTSVARASLAELLLDYEDFLRTRGLRIWEKDHRLVNRMRELSCSKDLTYETVRRAVEHPDKEIAANAIACLIRFNIYLLGRQISKLENEFLKSGGIREKMLTARRNEKSNQAGFQ